MKVNLAVSKNIPRDTVMKVPAGAACAVFLLNPLEPWSPSVSIQHQVLQCADADSSLFFLPRKPETRVLRPIVHT